MKPADRKVHYMTVNSKGPLMIIRTPFPLPKWRAVVQAVTPVLRDHGLRRKDLNALDGLTPFPDDKEAWTDEAKKFAERVDAGFAGAKDKVPAFWLYDWKDGEFVLVRKPIKPTKKNPIDDEIRDLERKESAGDLTAAEQSRLESLLARVGRPRLIVLDVDEIPSGDEFAIQAAIWRSDQDVFDSSLFRYAINLTSDDGRSTVDDMVRSGAFLVHADFDEIPGITSSRDRSSPETQNIEVLDFATADAAYIYLSRLHEIATGEVAIDNGLGGMKPETDQGVWYTGETEAGGFEIPPDLIDLSGLGVLPGDGDEAGDSIRVEDDLREATDLLDNADSQEDIDLAQAAINRLESIKEAVEEYVEGDQIYEVQAERGWGARLTLPGYMDSTTWHAVYRTERDALNALFEFEHDAISAEEEERLKDQAREMATEILAAFGFDRAAS